MKFIITNINKYLFKLINSIIIFYQKFISPITPASCRYYPTCSNYGKQALAWHGVWSGSWLLLKRISRCHPLGGHGVDFVPLPLATYSYQYLPNPSRATTVIKGTGMGVYSDDKSYVIRLNYLMKS